MLNDTRRATAIKMTGDRCSAGIITLCISLFICFNPGVASPEHREHPSFEKGLVVQQSQTELQGIVYQKIKALQVMVNAHGIMRDCALKKLKTSQTSHDREYWFLTAIVHEAGRIYYHIILIQWTFSKKEILCPKNIQEYPNAQVCLDGLKRLINTVHTFKKQANDPSPGNLEIVSQTLAVLATDTASRPALNNTQLDKKSSCLNNLADQYIRVCRLFNRYKERSHEK